MVDEAPLSARVGSPLADPGQKAGLVENRFPGASGASKIVTSKSPNVVFWASGAARACAL